MKFQQAVARFWLWWGDANAHKVVLIVRTILLTIFYIAVLCLLLSSDYRLWTLQKFFGDLIPTGGMPVSPAYHLGSGLLTLITGGKQ